MVHPPPHQLCNTEILQASECEETEHIEATRVLRRMESTAKEKVIEMRNAERETLGEHGSDRRKLKGRERR